LRSGV
jgi:hypothetical protein